MKFLIIAPSSKLNGTAKTFLTWIQKLYELDHKIILYTDNGNLANWTQGFCEKQLFFDLARLEPSLSRFFRIIKIINKYSIDVIWGVGTTSSLLGSLAGIVYNKRYLNILNVSPRTHVWPTNPNWKYPSAGHIVTVSEHYRNLLIYESKIPEKYCHFIPAQFDLDELKPVYQEAAKTHDKKIIISLFRRFDQQKAIGIELFLRFVEEYRASLLHCKFKLFGGGDSEIQINDRIKTLNELGIDITNHGFIKDVQNEMVKSDIIIGSERVAIESILCGKPVCIIGDHGIVNFVTKNNLELFMSDNFSGLGNSGQPLISLVETLDIFTDIEKLLSMCNVQYLREEIARKYDARVGIRELIQLSVASIPVDDRIIKVFRILRAIFLMYYTKIRIAFAKRVFTP